VRVLTIGETMVLLDGVECGLTLGAPFRLRIGGAESNFAVALCRLGVATTWISRVGADGLGDFLLGLLDAEGVDLRFVRREPDAPTGVFFKWHESGESRVLYRRAGSAASRLEPGDIVEDAFEGVAVVHLTGITSALSDGAHRTVVKVAEEANRRGLFVTFDPNYRPALWASPREAAARQREILPHVDHYLCGEAEGNLLFETGTLEGLRESALRAGAGEVVVRVGARGAVVWEEGSKVTVPPARLEQVVDEIGAGDGFDAGYVLGLLRGWSPTDRARAGNLIAARALLGTGDWETYPRLSEVAGDLGL
jgi:2-dehydro-3-deoxygluconokinase